MEIIGWLMVLVMCITGWLQHLWSKDRMRQTARILDHQLRSNLTVQVIQNFQQPASPKPKKVVKKQQQVRNYDDPQRSISLN